MPDALGIRRGTVRLTPYDARWPAMYRTERRRMLAAFGEFRPVIRHIGSTAVPGLTAKPIIDLLIGVRNLPGSRATIFRLARYGYEIKPPEEDFVPDRIFASRDVAGLRCYHLHFAELGGRFWKEHLLFRNILRRDHQLAKDYAALKQRLAKQFPADRLSYINGKAAFIAKAIKRGLNSGEIG